MSQYKLNIKISITPFIGISINQFGHYNYNIENVLCSFYNIYVGQNIIKYKLIFIEIYFLILNMFIGNVIIILFLKFIKKNELKCY